MKLSKALRKHAIENLGVAADASDEDMKAAINSALTEGKLTGEKFAALLAEKDAPETDVKAELADAIGERIGAILEKALAPKTEVTPEPKVEAPEPAAENSFDEDAFAEKMSGVIGAHVEKAMSNLPKPEAVETPDAWDILKGAVDRDEDGNIKSNPLGRYADTKYPAKREKGIGQGQQIMHNGKAMELSSESEKAMIGSWWKFTVCPEKLTEHEKGIVAHIIENERFVGADANTLESRKLRMDERNSIKSRFGTKAPLIDDSTSGGQEAVPEWYDTHVITLPVLGGEVAPFVTMVDVPRGSEVESFTIGNPTFASGATEGSAVTLFDATSLMADYSPAIFRAHGGVEIGKNLMADAAVNLASVIISRYGAKAAEWVDEQICNGDGTTEPQGLKLASSTVDITPATPTTGPLVIGDLLNLLFGVTKAYRQAYAKQKMAFVMTDETYKDLRSIATGVTGDTRLIFGQDDIFGYSLFGVPVAIEENGMANTDVIFAQLGGYRLYKRQGLRFVRESGGQELVSSNSELIYADMRYGGQIERGGYAALIDSAPV